MPERKRSDILLGIIALIMVAAALREAQQVILLVLLSFLLAYIMDPIVSLLKRIGLSLWLSVMIASLLFLGIFVGLGSALYVSMLDFATSFSVYQKRFIDLLMEITSRISTISEGRVRVDLFEGLKNLPIPSLAFSIARSLVSYITQFLLIFLFAVLFVYGKHNFQKKIMRVFSKKKGKRVPVVLGRIDREVRKYIALKTAISLATGVSAGVIMYLFGVKYALILGFLTFVLNYIPSLGSIIATFIPFFLALAQYGLAATPLWLFVSLSVMQTLIGNIMDPKLMGDTMNLSLFVVFLSLLFWGWMWGPAGVLLAVPMTTSIKIVLENIPSTSSFAVLLERNPRKHRGS